MTREKKNGPAPTKGGPATLMGGEPSTGTIPRLADLPHARANAGPPVPGRHLWAITVLSCPRCGGMHHHRAGEVAQLVRCCPTTGKRYRLSPVKRWREARRG